MIESCEYVLTAVANYLLTTNMDSTQVENPDLFEVIQKFIEIIENNLSAKRGLDDNDLFIICLQKTNFRWQLNKLFHDDQEQISWKLLATIMTYFAQVVEILKPINGNMYEFLHELYAFIKEKNVNTWIANQKGQWMSVLAVLNRQS
jgi:hypothetical protein